MENMDVVRGSVATGAKQEAVAMKQHIEQLIEPRDEVAIEAYDMLNKAVKMRAISTKAYVALGGKIVNYENRLADLDLAHSSYVQGISSDRDVLLAAQALIRAEHEMTGAMKALSPTEFDPIFDDE